MFDSIIFLTSRTRKRWWCNGQHWCLPSIRSGFDSRPSQTFLLPHLAFWRDNLSMKWVSLTSRQKVASKWRYEDVGQLWHRVEWISSGQKRPRRFVGWGLNFPFDKLTGLRLFVVFISFQIRIGVIFLPKTSGL